MMDQVEWTPWGALSLPGVRRAWGLEDLSPPQPVSVVEGGRMAGSKGDERGSEGPGIIRLYEGSDVCLLIRAGLA